MNAPKVGLALAQQTDASGAVRLVADDKVEVGQPRLLRFGHYIQRLVCGKDRIHGFGSVGEIVSGNETRRIRGRRLRKVERRQVAVVLLALSDSGVRADGECLQRQFSVVSPVNQGL